VIPRNGGSGLDWARTIDVQVLKAGAIYFAVVFGAGFILGPIRILVLVPRVGERVAELIETPFMLGVILFAARWIVQRFVTTRSPAKLVAVGCVALGLLLGCEFTVVLWLRGLTISAYMANRDSVAGVVYAVMLVVFAVMPLLMASRRLDPSNTA
jgi:hypothetical protein